MDVDVPVGEVVELGVERAPGELVDLLAVAAVVRLREEVDVRLARREPCEVGDSTGPARRKERRPEQSQYEYGSRQGPRCPCARHVPSLSTVFRYAMRARGTRPARTRRRASPSPATTDRCTPTPQQ